MIGVFDSGHGGLTILRALVERLPERAFCYLGDHAHAPYGERSPDAVYSLTLENVERLFGLGCRLVLLACNTAAAVALRRLQQTWLPAAHPERRVLGVLVPLVEAVTEVPWAVAAPPPGKDRAASTVAVFATRTTVASGAYVLEIGLRAPAIRVEQQACPGLVDAIERDAPAEDTRRIVQDNVAALIARLGGRAPDAAILACTHYPLVDRDFVAALPPSVRLYRQPEIVAASLADYLERHPEFDQAGPAPESLRFLTTGDPVRATRLGSRFFGAPVAFESASPLRPARSEAERAPGP